MSDVIETLAGLPPGSPIAALRAGLRPTAKQHAEASHRSLFEPLDASSMSVAERFAVARFVAGLHGRPETIAFYEQGLAAAGASPALQAAVSEAVAAGQGAGPWGHYPKGPLSAEDQDGKELDLAPALKAALGVRLAAAFAHAHMLVLHPRDSAPRYLQALIDAGWTTDGIVVLSQLVSFLSFQIRVVAGLRILQARPA